MGFSEGSLARGVESPDQQFDKSEKKRQDAAKFYEAATSEEEEFVGVDEYGEPVFDANDSELQAWLAKQQSAIEGARVSHLEVSSQELLSLLNQKAEELLQSLPSLSKGVLGRWAQQEAEEELMDFGYIEGLLGQPMMEMKECPEVVREWGRQVGEMYDGVQAAWPGDTDLTADFSRLVEQMKVAEWKGQKITEDKDQPFQKDNLRKIFSKIEAGMTTANREVNEEVKKMAAIGLWMWKNQGIDWPGIRPVYLRLFTTRSARLSDYLDNEGASSCVDKAFMMKAMAQQLELEGEVKRIKRGPLDRILRANKQHHYFQTKSGIVGDLLWYSGRAGVVPQEELQDKYEQLAQRDCSDHETEEFELEQVA